MAETTITLRVATSAARVRTLLRAGRADLVWPLPTGMTAQPLPYGYHAVARDARPYLGRACVEAQLDEPRMREHALDLRLQRSERQTIACGERRRGRTVFRPRVEIARTEHERRALREVGGRELAAPGEAHLDCGARAPVHAMQARRQRRGVVGDDEIVAAQELRELSARGVRQAAVRAHHE